MTEATAVDRAFRALTTKLAADLTRGQHLVLWGPRGSGKTTLLNAVLQELGSARCALSATTSSLDDITRALERAYADVATTGLTRRAARSRLWWAADAAPGCLLLDHVTRVPSAMKGWLRRLRGGVVGVTLAVDVDSPRERERLRAMKFGCMTLRMPPTASRTLSRLLTRAWSLGPAFALPTPARRTLVRAARGRPGWIVQCATLAAAPRYWHAQQLRAHVLALDTEMRLRAVNLTGQIKQISD
jgi:energy-coupling factor transporter ATP-binding protein EcfA2